MSEKTPIRPYVAFSEGKFTVILQGMPLCADKKTLAEVLAFAKTLGARPQDKIADVAWNGDRCEFVHLSTIS